MQVIFKDGNNPYTNKIYRDWFSRMGLSLDMIWDVERGVGSYYIVKPSDKNILLGTTSGTAEVKKELFQIYMPITSLEQYL